jgi:LemA protein
VSGLIVLVVLVVLLVIAGLWVAGIHNGLVRLRNLVLEAWRLIDLELARRHELVPNLVQTVQSHSWPDRSPLDAVVAARAAAVATGSRAAVGPVSGRAADEGALTAALGRLFAVAGARPELQVDQNFLALQTELADIEDRVAAGRRFYNANVRELNSRLDSFPSNVLSGPFQVARADYFELRDAAPQVSRVGSAVPAPVGPGDRPVPGSAR